jgi:glycosyltransferase A (GT-A) superfamily protein (DUF2064 family)
MGPAEPLASQTAELVVNIANNNIPQLILYRIWSHHLKTANVVVGPTFGGSFFLTKPSVLRQFTPITTRRIPNSTANGWRGRTLEALYARLYLKAVGVSRGGEVDFRSD